MDSTTGAPATRQPLIEKAAPRRITHWRASLALLVGLAASGVVASWLYGRYIVPKDVAAFRVEMKPIPWSVRGPGLTDATNKVTITAPTYGRLLRVNVQRNASVKIGDVLAELEANDLRNQVASALADAEAATQAVSVTRSVETKARAAKEKLAADVERRTGLAATGVVSRADLEALQSLLRQAEAELEGSMLSIDRALAQQRAAHANAQAFLARLNDSVIRSPMDGIVVSRDRNVGDVVLPGAVILQIVEPSSIIISARFDESNLGALSTGRPAKVSFVSDPRKEYAGKLLRLGRQVDQETREFTADIELGELPSNWALGQRARVSVEVGTVSQHPIVPQRFIKREDGKTGIWAKNAGYAQWRQVRVGYSTGPLIEVIEGLQPGDIVLDPSNRYAFEPVTPQFSWP